MALLTADIERSVQDMGSFLKTKGIEQAIKEIDKNHNNNNGSYGE
jgi:hypothetical protein